MGRSLIFQANLLSLRIFLLSSVLDTIFFALTVVSIGILITYADIRSLMCEQIASGEVHALLAYLRGANRGHATPAPPDDPTYVTAAAPTPAASEAGGMARPMSNGSMPMARRAPSMSVATLPAMSLISQASSNLWKRALGAGTATDDEATASSFTWWDSMLDNLLDNESCDEIFASLLVPLGLLLSLLYLAIRIHFVIVIRAHYTAVLRSHMGFFLCPSSANTATGDSGSSATTDSPSSSPSPPDHGKKAASKTPMAISEKARSSFLRSAATASAAAADAERARTLQEKLA